MAVKRIEWNDAKNRGNRTKHGIGFTEASDVFFDPLAITVHASDHSLNEFRFISIGKTRSNKLLVVFFTETDEEIRIFSARRPTRTERLTYEEEY